MSFLYLDWAILALAAMVAALAVMVEYLLNRFQKATRVINNQGEAIDGIMALSSSAKASLARHRIALLKQGEMNFMLLDRLGIQDFDAPEIQDIISYGRKEIAECEEHAKNMESYADEFYERYMKEK